MQVEFKLSGARELQRALAHYQTSMRKDVYNALKKAAYEVSRSLISRTKQAKKGPKISVASKADLATLAPLMPTPAAWKTTPEQFRHYVKSLGRKVFVARSDRPKDHGFRAKTAWKKDRFSKQELVKRMAYKRTGLAKASWRWSSKKAKSGNAVAEGNAQVRRSIRDNCAVRADQNHIRIVISNHLPYIKQALVSAGAVDAAMRAAANSMRAQAEQALAKRAKKEGIAS